MHVVITGGRGFIGTRLSRRFIAENHMVTTLDNGYTAVSDKISGATNINVDLTDAEALETLSIPPAEILVHLGGPTSGPDSILDPVGTVSMGYAMTYNAMLLAKRLAVKRVINASSMVIYGNPALDAMPVKEDHASMPLSYYGVMKLANERMVEIFCKGNNIGFNSLRLFNVYGPGQDIKRTDSGLVGIFLAQLLKEPKVVVKGSLERFRDIVHVEDVVGAFYACATNCDRDGPVNAAYGNKNTIGELINLISNNLNISDCLEIDVQAGTAGDQFGIYADVSRLKEWTCYQPLFYPERGIKDFIDWVGETI